MARVFITMPGGKLKRISNRIRTNRHDGKDYYRQKRRPSFIRDQDARSRVRSYGSEHAI